MRAVVACVGRDRHHHRFAETDAALPMACPHQGAPSVPVPALAAWAKGIPSPICYPDVTPSRRRRAYVG